MNDIIEKLSYIESSATTIIDEAHSQKKVLAEKNEEKISRMEEEINASTKEQIKALQEEIKIKIENKLKAQKDAADKEIAAINKEYEKNHIYYVNKLFDELTGA